MTSWLTYVSRTFIVLLITGALAAPVADSFAQQERPPRSQSNASPFVEINEDELLVLEIRMDNKSTGQGMLAYKSGDEILVPLGELCSILELAIMVDSEAGTAKGWIVDEDRDFELSLPAQTVTRNGNLSPLPPSSVARDSEEIYVMSSIITQWLPLEMEIDLPRMYVTIQPREILPFQSRLKRDEQRANWLHKRGKAKLSFPLHNAPYRLWSWPLVNATGTLLTGRQQTSRRLALQGNADLAGHSSNLFVSHVGNSMQHRTVSRLKMSRWDPDGTLMGPLSATRYEIGDLFISRIPLISTRQQGLGASISNQNFKSSKNFETTEIQGDAPPGWDAEIYINGSLYDFQTVGESGRYIFSDLPMSIGNNTFRTVLYGTRGETREIVDNANISPEMTETGKLKYNLAAVREGIGTLSPVPVRADSLAQTWNQQLEISMALSSKHALSANFSRINTTGTPELFSSLTSHNSLGRLYLESIVGKSLRGGAATSIAARAKLNGHNFFALFNQNNNYLAEALSDRSYLNKQTLLSINGNLFNFDRRRVFYNISAANRHYIGRDLKSEQSLKANVSTSFKRFILSHNWQFKDKIFSDYGNREATGSQLLRTRIGGLSVRGNLNYASAPFQVKSTGTSISWMPSQSLRLNSRATHFLAPEFGRDNVSADLTRYFDKMSLSATYNYFKGGGSAIGMTLGTFLSRDIRSNTWAVQHRQMANRSVASVLAYIDKNSNRIYDEDDEPLPGIGFRNLSAWKKVRTNEKGFALLPGMQNFNLQTIEIDLSTIVDPFLVPLDKGANVIGHPGSFVEVEFPFSYMGEMEGMIMEAGSQMKPIRHVGLEILDLEGNRVKATVGEFDGFYYFADIIPGDYKLSVIKTTVNTNKYEIPAPYPISITGDGGYIEGPDIVFELKSGRPSVTPVIAPVVPVEETQETEEEAPPVLTEAAPEPDSGNVEPVEVEVETEVPVEVATKDVAAESTEGQTQTTAATPVTSESAIPEVENISATPAPLADVGEFDEELTLSLIFEILNRNSLWPDEQVQ